MTTSLRPLPNAGLPRFARICSSICSRLGLDPWSLASPAQRSWIESARRALLILDPDSSRAPTFKFLALDERFWGRSAERAWSSVAELASAREFADQPPAHLAHLISTPFGAANGERAASYVALSFFDPPGQAAFAALRACLGSDDIARCFVIAHEWAHAWQADHGFPAAKHAAIAAGSPLSILALDLLRGAAQRSDRPPHSSTPDHAAAALALKTIEEAFCDAAGCWVAEALGCAGAASKIAAFRKVSAAVAHASARYHNHDILCSMLPRALPIPLDFSSFARQASRLGAEPSRRLFGPKAPSPSAAPHSRPALG